ncbi:hypothetical protein L1987_16542 [Smallanthus sonchifolius]|uniref:Uncharacterized protein n=1 Tax=Smallanthus sonchifolius TaxID=185202 RepID=A0ACB9JC53_9ASTR|nr:hypothetical protein L1987_16542 [Smallanthus sonchifolius]
MDSFDQRRKRKFRSLSLKPIHHLFSATFLLCFLSFFALFYILFRPSFYPVPVDDPTLFKVDDRVLFPDHILVLVAGTRIGSWNKRLECCYTDSREEVVRDVLSLDEYDDIRWLVRCPLPPANFSSALTAAQEVVRCVLPTTLQTHPEKAHGIRVTVSFRGSQDHLVMLQSVAKIPSPRLKLNNTKKHELCVCTMLWNQAGSIREWITYHSWLGVERWFIYDNNSDDEIQEVVKKLHLEGFNVSRHVWPWIKTQEAGFSHCAIRARDECNWVSFMDVDEFYYFPRITTPASLKNLVSNYTSSSIGELRTSCRSFGPSGLTSPPKQGVTVGYTCRLQSPERHKSIIRPDAIDTTLMNVVHHFHLRKGFGYKNVLQSTAVINHYKYQVWEAFRAKFYRRVATYVADWQDNHNEGSRDRAPGLGTEAIEPSDWRLRFCEVWDTGLRDFVLGKLADIYTGVLPWDIPT